MTLTASMRRDISSNQKNDVLFLCLVPFRDISGDEMVNSPTTTISTLLFNEHGDIPFYYKQMIPPHITNRSYILPLLLSHGIISNNYITYQNVKTVPESDRYSFHIEVAPRNTNRFKVEENKKKYTFHMLLPMNEIHELSNEMDIDEKRRKVCNLCEFFRKQGYNDNIYKTPSCLIRQIYIKDEDRKRLSSSSS